MGKAVPAHSIDAILGLKYQAEKNSDEQEFEEEFCDVSARQRKKERSNCYFQEDGGKRLKDREKGKILVFFFIIQLRVFSGKLL